MGSNLGHAQVEPPICHGVMNMQVEVPISYCAQVVLCTGAAESTCVLFVMVS
jgi:hypothetical protein